MIKVLFLIFEPVKTWSRIAEAKAKAIWVLFLFLLPLLALTLAGELWGIWHWGKAPGYLGKPAEIVGEPVKLGQDLLIHYGIAQFVSSLVLVVLSAAIMKSFARTFVSRHTYNECFAVTAYAFGPLFLLRLCDALPNMNPWASFAIGIFFTSATLYHGIPVLDPDPPHAFGLYVSSLLLLVSLSALVRFLTLLILAQKIHF